MAWRIEVLKWEDNSGKGLVQRIPEQGMADLKTGARCLVQESQQAVFFRNGKALDTLGPGNHTLTTENIPIISKLYKLAYTDHPFQSAVYFVSMKPQRDMKFGTKDPISLRDAEFGYVNVRCFGKFTIRVTDAKMFINTLVGTKGRHDAKDFEREFKDVIVTALGDIIAEQMQGKSVLDLERMKRSISAVAKEELQDEFAKYGCELYELYLASINVPEKLTQAMNTRGAMGAIGNMQQYMQYQAANAIEKGAGNPNNPMGGMMGAGMGMGMGMMMPGMMAQGMGYPPPPPGYPPQYAQGHYPPPPPPGYYPPQQGYPPQGYAQHPGYPPQQGQMPPGQAPQGYPQQGHPPQGHPQQGQPPQGYPQQAPGYPPQGYAQGQPPQGYPQQGHPQQGQPPQGYPQHPGQPPQPPMPPQAGGDAANG